MCFLAEMFEVVFVLAVIHLFTIIVGDLFVDALDGVLIPVIESTKVRRKGCVRLGGVTISVPISCTFRLETIHAP